MLVHDPVDGMSIFRTRVGCFRVSTRWPRAHFSSEGVVDHDGRGHGANERLPWHQMVLEFEFSLYLADPASQAACIRAVEGIEHGCHISVPKAPQGFSRFQLTAFGTPYIHPYHKILGLGYGDLAKLHNGCHPMVRCNGWSSHCFTMAPKHFRSTPASHRSTPGSTRSSHSTTARATARCAPAASARHAHCSV
jgi:hypothetical protein